MGHLMSEIKPQAIRSGEPVTIYELLKFYKDKTDMWISSETFTAYGKKIAKKLCKKGLILGGYAKSSKGYDVRCYKWLDRSGKISTD